MKNIYAIGLIISFLIAKKAFAQYENIWAFGYHAGLDFNSGTPVAIKTAIETREGTATICDPNGHLLFYTDGSTVYDRNHDTMPSGNIFPPNDFILSNGWSPTESTTQGAAIVPDPGNRYRYYLFSLQNRTPVGTDYCTGRLSYSVVDMTLNNGLGDVVSGEKDIYLDTLLIEPMTVIPGTNCDVWLLVSEISDKTIELESIPKEDRHYRIKAYNVSTNGVEMTPVVSDSLPLHLPDHHRYGLPGHDFGGTFTVSNDYGKLVASMGTLTFYDFDRLTGKVSNPVTIPKDERENFWYSCFSADDSKLYAIQTFNNGYIKYLLAQFDLPSLYPVSIDPNSVYLNIMHTDTTWGLSTDTLMVRRIKMGPDKKLYFTHWNWLPIFGDHDPVGRRRFKHMGVINAPNQIGMACDVQLFAIELQDSTHAQMSIPNNQVILPEPTDTVTTRRYAFIGCSDSLLLIPSNTGGWAYRWDNEQSTISRVVDSVGAYMVGYHTDNSYCSINIDSFFVSEVLSCYNGSTGRAFVNKHPSDPNQYNYIWMNASQDTISYADTLSGVPAGKYYVWIQSAQDSMLVCFTINEISENVSFDPSALIACQGDTLDFTNTSSSYYTAFEWQENKDSLSDTFHLRHTFPDAGSYDIRLIGRGKVCIDTFFKTIIVDSMLPGAFQVEPEEVCVGRPVTLYPFVDSSAKGLHWTFASLSSRIEAFRTNSYQHAFDRPGTHPVTLQAQFRACPDTSYTDSITVYPLPEVDLGEDSSICLHGAPVYLKNVREAPPNPHHYLWSTGDTTATLKVVHPGTYTLSVSTEPIGCTTTESIAITKDCYIDIPNAFTPNGDGHNDYFFPRQLLSESISRFRMQVFNRWGQLIFETTNLDGRGWDGCFNDKTQPMGVYLYRIEVGFTNGREEQYEGNVTLVR